MNAGSAAAKAAVSAVVVAIVVDGVKEEVLAGK